MSAVLFVCVANSCRSQMAEAIAKKLSKGRFDIDSCGVSPGYDIESGARALLEGKGYDLSAQHPKGFSEVKPLDQYKAVVLLCSEACVDLPELSADTLLEKWNLGDPSVYIGNDRVSAYEGLYDTISSRTQTLFEKIKS